ncbi:hypothetical protein EV356DRAFT_502372 [Viridothelium virens]|uniref:SnoaL-like domain-containing protein n=1 Tax=Viridothelium virens TaxID=1048519 RepID=A0A6A6HMX1_VIRVR|nr:hypothetical protein EV356DRAFT_502372 [Viridothelium virens]
MAATLASDVKLIHSPDVPYGGVYEGPEGFRKWAEEMSRYFDIVDVQNPQVLENGDLVVVVSNLKLRVRESQQEWENPFTQVIKVDRQKGVITEIRPFYWDLKGLNAVLRRTA